MPYPFGKIFIMAGDDFAGYMVEGRCAVITYRAITARLPCRIFSCLFTSLSLVGILRADNENYIICMEVHL
jgi:hypothetical protein